MVYTLPASEALAYRKRYRGVIGIESKIPIKDRSVLSLIYTPGVAEPCLEIAKNPATSFDYTIRGNTIALVTDGSAVLGLGNIGPEAALPVMEGKSVMFKNFAGVDAFPICLATQNVDEIVNVITYLSTTFGGVCLEDISAPRCFTIEEQLQRALNIPVFHNDQHATAAVVLAGLINALKVVGKSPDGVRVVVNGAGAAGIAVARTLRNAGFRDVVLCDRAGVIYKYRPMHMSWVKYELSRITNPKDRRGSLTDVLEGADILIGLSNGNLVSEAMVRSMAADAIVFALAEPVPEIGYHEAKAAGARVVATGRPNLPNEINIALAFPGIFRGALDVRARHINEAMIIAAARALADQIDTSSLSAELIVPSLLDYRIAPAIARAVAEAAIATGTARIKRDPNEIESYARRYIYEGRRPVPPRSIVPSNGRHSDGSINGATTPTDAAMPTPPSLSAANLRDEALELRRRYQGVLSIKNKMPIRDQGVLNAFYLPPGYSSAVREISQNHELLFDYTIKGNLLAIVTDGSAVLGLGNIGPRAAMPVMEGKAVLVNAFAGVEAFPICLATQDVDEIVATVKAISTTFGAINLEDIAAPRCFEVEERLKAELDIPVMHDDQHATAIVVLAGIINALKITGRSAEKTRVVINGVGAAGVAVTKLLQEYGIGDIILVDRKGILYDGGDTALNDVHRAMAAVTNTERRTGTLADALVGSDVFVGLSAPRLVSQDMVRSMAKDAIVFALANPTPEIMPEEAIAAGARVVASGRSDYDNQVNNSLAFPGIFRGALDVRARHINEAMKMAAAKAIAGMVLPADLDKGIIIPRSMDFTVPPRVAAAVARAAIETGEARRIVDPEAIARSTRDWIYEGVLTPLDEA